MKYGRTFAALWMAFQTAACQGPAEPDERSPEPPPSQRDTAVTVSGVSAIVPGENAVLSGRNLSRLTSLTVGGRTVGFEPVSDTQVRFTVPEDVAAACDVDGRSVAVVANGTVEASGDLDLRTTIGMEVGESRILKPEDLVCLQLPAGMEEWVLHVSDFRTERGPAQRVFDLESRTVEGAPPASALSAVRSVPQGRTMAPSPSVAPALAMTRAAGERVVVEPKLATAQVGDTLLFVDWSAIGDPQKTQPDESFLHHTVVVAVEGSHVIVVDTRYPNWESFTRGALNQTMQQAASLADRYGVRAIRAVMQPGFEVPQGAAGRTFTVIDPTMHYDGGAGASNDQYGKEYYPLAAEVLRVDVKGVEDMRAEAVASMIIHEMAHGADAQIHYRNGWRGGSGGWYAEAVAEQVSETAARMHAGAATGVKTADASLINGHLAHWPSWRTDKSPWGEEMVGVGPYDAGARILLYAREKYGEMGFEQTGPTLHQRLSAMERWDVTAIAEVLGTTARQLLEEAHLASLTDDRIPVPHSLPQYESYDNTQSDPGDYTDEAPGGHVLSRTEPVKVPADVAAGHHQHWYVDADASRGLSIEVRRPTLGSHHQVRLTRLR